MDPLRQLRMNLRSTYKGFDKNKTAARKCDFLCNSLTVTSNVTMCVCVCVCVCVAIHLVMSHLRKNIL